MNQFWLGEALLGDRGGPCQRNFLSVLPPGASFPG